MLPVDQQAQEFVRAHGDKLRLLSLRELTVNLAGQEDEVELAGAFGRFRKPMKPTAEESRQPAERSTYKL
jgi:hypothetical protein